MQILLVEDDEGHAELVKINLERSGLVNAIIHFRGGKNVMDFLSQAARRQRYLIILDINMPGLDGHQLLARLKGNERTRAIPVIVLTTAQDEREVERCYALGSNFYMIKPMEYTAFCEAVRELGLFIRKARFPGSSMLMAG